MLCANSCNSYYAITSLYYHYLLQLSNMVLINCATSCLTYANVKFKCDVIAHWLLVKGCKHAHRSPNPPPPSIASMHHNYIIVANTVVGTHTQYILYTCTPIPPPLLLLPKTYWSNLCLAQIGLLYKIDISCFPCSLKYVYHSGQYNTNVVAYTREHAHTHIQHTAEEL